MSVAGYITIYVLAWILIRLYNYVIHSCDQLKLWNRWRMCDDWQVISFKGTGQVVLEQLWRRPSPNLSILFHNISVYLKVMVTFSLRYPQNLLILIITHALQCPSHEYTIVIHRLFNLPLSHKHFYLLAADGLNGLNFEIRFHLTLSCFFSYQFFSFTNQCMTNSPDFILSEFH